MSESASIEELVSHFQLEAHPEGGFFREVYRNEGKLQPESLPAGMSGLRNYLTSIFFLLPQGHKSHLHRLRSDEVWYYHQGGPLRILELQADGKTRSTILGPNWARGQKFQHVVPAGTWFGALPEPESAFCFVGCAVAPGFDFQDFEMGRRDVLLKDYAEASHWIQQLTPSPGHP